MSTNSNTSDISVEKSRFYNWVQEGSNTPITWVTIEVDGTTITSNEQYSYKKEANVLYSPPYFNMEQTNQNYSATTSRSYAYTVAPMIVAFSRMKSPNLTKGIDSIFQKQQEQKKPEVTITFEETNMPQDGAVKVIKKTVCKNCILLGVKMELDIIYLKFSFGTATETTTEATGVIAQAIDNWGVTTK
jgi:hypothetical protein